MTAVQEAPQLTRLINPETGVRFEFPKVTRDFPGWLRSSPATDKDVRKGLARFRGDQVWLPLPPGVQAQLEKGVLQFDTEYQAREALEAAAGIAGEPVPQPAGNASRETWISYAISQGMDRGEATALSRDQIKARFAEPAFDPDAPPETVGDQYALLNDKP